MDIEKEQRSRMFEAAHKTHDSHRKYTSDSIGLLSAFATNALRAPAITAAAGIAGLLGFFSANKSQIIGTIGVSDFNTSITYFCIAVGLSAVAPSTAYLAQKCYTRALDEADLSYEHPFILQNRRSTAFRNTGHVWTYLSIALVVGALISTGTGATYFLRLATFLTG